MNLNLNTCALCKQMKELKLSHIVPKFVIRYLKKTSKGAIRNTQNPNKTIQDGEKHYLLCGDCEELFSKSETVFSNKFFYPYMVDNIKEFSYDNVIYYFLTSVSWRSLYLDILDFVEHSNEININIETLDCLISREKEMREYLLKDKTVVNGMEHHIFFFEDIKEISNDLISMKPHTTFHRSLTSYTFFNNKFKTHATITNMMGIILFTLYSKNSDEIWENTEIINGTGIIKAENQRIESVCGNELNHILNTAKNGENELSKKQKDNINEKVKNNIDDFKNSKSFEDLKKDFNL